jgi:hypothetical protein
VLPLVQAMPALPENEGVEMNEQTQAGQFECRDKQAEAIGK